MAPPLILAGVVAVPLTVALAASTVALARRALGGGCGAATEGYRTDGLSLASQSTFLPDPDATSAQGAAETLSHEDAATGGEVQNYGTMSPTPWPEAPLLSSDTV